MTAPRRRWLRFTLRTLFVVVTLFGCWLGYQLNWIRQRHEFLRDMPFGVSQAEPPPQFAAVGELISGSPPNAPWPLGWFGEHGCYGINAFGWGEVRLSELDLARAKRLFPEAEVTTEPQPNPRFGKPRISIGQPRSGS